MKSLVFVVGAGASNEVGFPIGAGLKDEIASQLDIRYDESGFNQINGDFLLENALKQYQQLASGKNGRNYYLKSCWRIRDAIPQSISIDNLVDSHRSDADIALCAKLAIVRCILDAEKNSTLSVDRSNIYNTIKFSRITNTWFNSFFQNLHENCNFIELIERLKRVAIISFNYDRSIEHFLYYSLQNYYGVSADEAALALSHLAIYHPYGAVGQLPWQINKSADVESIEYGERPTVVKLISIAKQLRTFSEGTDPKKSDIESIRQLVTDTNRLVFLGFAFHQINLALLFPGSDILPSKINRIFATAMSLSDSDCNLIHEYLVSRISMQRNRIYIRNDRTCFALFNEYRRSLLL